MRFFPILALLSAPYATAVETSVEKRATSTLMGCIDSVDGWVDKMDSPCSWYAEEPGARCALADLLKSDDGEADDVCCACGGGTPTDDDGMKEKKYVAETEEKISKEETAEPEEERVSALNNLGCGKCEDKSGWKDAFLSDCSFYEEHTDLRCSLAFYGTNNGVDASEACCACGGGKREGCDGNYYIQSVASGLYLAIQKHGNRVPYVNAFGSQNLLTNLEIESVGDDLYSIKSAYYGDRYMCVGGDGNGVTTCGSVGKSAKWKIDTIKSNSNQIIIQSYSNDKYLDYVSPQNPSYYPVGLNNKNSDQNTKFKLISIKSTLVTEKDLEVTSKKKNLRVA